MSLILNDITHHYGDTLAVSSARLEAVPGEILCLFGPSGCGKTTLLRLAAGLEQAQQGSVELDGTVLSSPEIHIAPEKRPVGFVFQDYVLFPHLTVSENVAFGLRDLPRGERRERVKTELDGVGLAEFGNRYPHQLSGGQQQRVALARAFARRPRAMLLDEPFASIDAVRRRQLRDDIRRILKARDAAAILVTHDPEEALALGDQIAIMREGRIVETASPKALFEEPKTAAGASVFPGAQIITARRDGNQLHTAFGIFTSGRDGADGMVDFVLHEGGVTCEPNADSDVTVVDCRFTGPDWLVFLKSAGGGAKLLARSQQAHAVGAAVGVLIDPLQSFEFAKPA